MKTLQHGSSHTESIKALLASTSATPATLGLCIQNNNGETALMIAIQHDLLDVAALFTQLGGVCEGTTSSVREFVFVKMVKGNENKLIAGWKDTTDVGYQQKSQ